MPTPCTTRHTPGCGRMMTVSRHCFPVFGGMVEDRVRGVSQPASQPSIRQPTTHTHTHTPEGSSASGRRPPPRRTPRGCCPPRWDRRARSLGKPCRPSWPPAPAAAAASRRTPPTGVVAVGVGLVSAVGRSVYWSGCTYIPSTRVCSACTQTAPAPGSGCPPPAPPPPAASPSAA